MVTPSLLVSLQGWDLLEGRPKALHIIFVPYQLLSELLLKKKKLQLCMF